MKRIIKTGAFLICLLLAAVYIGDPAAAAAYKGVCEKTLRLHILADSNEPDAQALKLALRDALSDYISPLLENAEDTESAEAILKTNLAEIEGFAQEFIAEKGSDLSVRAVLGEEFYPTRTYGDCAYPAGKYTSLRLFIGSGEGKNWWCVVFPPLCLSASGASGEALENYSDEEQALILRREPSYKVRFLFLDLAARLKEFFSPSTGIVCRIRRLCRAGNGFFAAALENRTTRY